MNMRPLLGSVLPVLFQLAWQRGEERVGCSCRSLLSFRLSAHTRAEINTAFSLHSSARLADFSPVLVLQLSWLMLWSGNPEIVPGSKNVFECTCLGGTLGLRAFLSGLSSTPRTTGSAVQTREPVYVSGFVCVFIASELDGGFPSELWEVFWQIRVNCYCKPLLMRKKQHNFFFPF